MAFFQQYESELIGDPDRAMCITNELEQEDADRVFRLRYCGWFQVRDL